MAQLIQHLTINELLPLFKIQYLEQAIQGALAAGQEKKESLQLHLCNFNLISNTPVAPHQLSCQISANQHKTETTANVHVNKH